MSGAELVVVLGAIGAIAWVNWFFFLASRGPVVARAGADGVQEVVVTVQGGYSPQTVTVKRGVPVRLLFDRQETSGCSEEVVLPDLGVKRFLPAWEKTPVEFTPDRAGRYGFTCGMSMLRGSVVVED